MYKYILLLSTYVPVSLRMFLYFLPFSGSSTWPVSEMWVENSVMPSNCFRHTGQTNIYSIVLEANTYGRPSQPIAAHCLEVPTPTSSIEWSKTCECHQSIFFFLNVCIFFYSSIILLFGMFHAVCMHMYVYHKIHYFFYSVVRAWVFKDWFPHYLFVVSRFLCIDYRNKRVPVQINNLMHVKLSSNCVCHDKPNLASVGTEGTSVIVLQFLL